MPASHYISNGIVCDDGQEFVTSTSTCTAIDASTYPNCNQVSGAECVGCSTGYLIQGKCCPDGEYSNGGAC